MNKKKNYNVGSRRLEIIKALYMCGVVPYDCLSYMHCDTEMIRRVCRKMEEEGVVTKQKVNKRKTIAFAKYKDIPKIIPEIDDFIPDGYPEYYEAFSSNARHKALFGKDETEKERYLSNAGAMMFSRYSGAMAYLDEKPPITSLADVKGEMNIYYSLRDLRQLYDLDEKKVKTDTKTQSVVMNSRANGILVTEAENVYPVYNIGQRTIKWSRTGEMSFLNRLKRILRENGLNMENDECAVIYKGDQILSRILNYKKGRSYTTIHVDLSYDHMYFLPDDKYGQLLMQFMMSKNWRERALYTVLGKSKVENARYCSFKTDGYDPVERVYYNVFCIPDMVHLSLFKQNADSIQDKDKFIIYCFSFQKDFIEENFRDIATIKVVNFVEYIKKVREITTAQN